MWRNGSIGRIRIKQLYKGQGMKLCRPHLHAAFGGEEAVLGLDGELLDGELPKGKMKLLLAWMEIHHEELEANWELLCNNEPAFKIDPLK